MGYTLSQVWINVPEKESGTDVMIMRRIMSQHLHEELSWGNTLLMP